MNKEDVGKRLEDARLNSGMSKKKVADALGLAYSTYCCYEYGSREPGSDVLVKAAELYEISVDELLGIEKAPENTEPMVTRDQLVDFLLSAGLINEGEDLSDSDLHFLEALIAAAAEWFSAKNA